MNKCAQISSGVLYICATIFLHIHEQVCTNIQWGFVYNMCNYFLAYTWTSVHKYPVGFCISVQLFSCIYMNKCAQISSGVLYIICATVFLHIHEQVCTNIQWGFVYNMCNCFPAYTWTSVHKYPVGFCISVQLFSCIYMNKCAQISSGVSYIYICAANFPAYLWTNVHKYPEGFCIYMCAAVFLHMHEQVCPNIQRVFVYICVQLFSYICMNKCAQISRGFLYIYVCSCFPTYAWTSVPKYPEGFCIYMCAAVFLHMHEQMCTNIQRVFVYICVQLFSYICMNKCAQISRGFLYIYVCSCFPTYAWTNVPKYPVPFTQLHSSHRGNISALIFCSRSPVTDSDEEDSAESSTDEEEEAATSPEEKERWATSTIAGFMGSCPSLDY